MGQFVLEFTIESAGASLKQQIMVREGEDFGVTTFCHGVHWRVSGKVETIVDGVAPVRLAYEVKSGGSFGVKSSTPQPYQLKIDQYRGGGWGDFHLTIGKLWVRRQLDPVPALTASVAQRREYWEASMCYLGDLRGEGAPAVPELIKVLSDKSLDADHQRKPYENPRRYAAEALGDIALANDAVLAALVRATRDQNAYVRLDAAEALWKLVRHAASVPTAVAALDDEDHFVRSAAAHLLETISPDAPEVAAKLRAMLTDDDEFARIAAACAIWKIARDEAALAVLRRTRDTGQQEQARRAAEMDLWEIERVLLDERRQKEDGAAEADR